MTDMTLNFEASSTFQPYLLVTNLLYVDVINKLANFCQKSLVAILYKKSLHNLISFIYSYIEWVQSVISQARGHICYLFTYSQRFLSSCFVSLCLGSKIFTRCCTADVPMNHE